MKKQLYPLILLFIFSSLDTLAQGICTFTGRTNEDWSEASNWECELPIGTVNAVPNAAIREIYIPMDQTVRLSQNIVLTESVQLTVQGVMFGTFTSAGTGERSIFMNTNSSIVIKPNGSIRNLRELKLESRSMVSIEPNGILDLIGDLSLGDDSELLTTSTSCIQVTSSFENTESARVTGSGCITFRGNARNNINFTGGTVFGCTPTSLILNLNETISEETCGAVIEKLTAQNDIVCAQNNDTIQTQVFRNDLLGNETIGLNDVERITVVNGPQHGDFSINPNGTFQITYLPFGPLRLNNRNGIDSLVYEITTKTGQTDQATLYYVFQSIDLPDSLKTCTSTLQAIPTALELEGRWMFNPLEVALENPNQSNTNITLLDSVATIEWVSDLGCDPTPIFIRRDTVLINGSFNERNVYCSNETRIDLNQRFGITPLPGHVSTWFVNESPVSDQFINTANLINAQSSVRYEVQFGICTGRYTDTLELDEVSAEFEIEDEICQSVTPNELINLNNLRTNTYPNTRDFKSVWRINDIQNERLNISNVGEFTLEHTASFNSFCSEVLIKNVKVETSLMSSFDFPSHICRDSSVIILSSIEPFGQWFLNTTNNSILQINPLSLTPNQTYVLIRKNGVADNCGTQSERSFVIETPPSSKLNPFNTPLCVYADTIDLSTRVQDPSPEDVVEWRLGTTPVLSINPLELMDSTQLNFSTQNTSGSCRKEESEILRSFTPEPSTTLTSLVLNDSLATVRLPNSNYKAINRSPETFDIEQIGTAVNIQPKSINVSGRITETEINGFGCTSTLDYMFFFEELLTADAGPDITEINTNTLNLSAIPPSFGTGMWVNSPTNAFISEPLNPQSPVTLSSESSATLTWSVSTPGGQMASDQMVISNQETRSILVPEAFSPNGDGINDVFEIVGLEPDDQVFLIVINRWGQKKYESTDYFNDQKWNGEDDRGNRLPSDTYIIRYKINEEPEKSKAVVLKR